MRYEGIEVSKDVFDGFPVPKVIFSAVENDAYGSVSGKEFVEVVNDLIKLGPSESTIEQGPAQSWIRRVPT